MNQPTKSDMQSWKAQVYVLGTAIGTIIGFLSSYLYARAAEDDADQKGKPERISTMQLLTLGVALLGLIRQITELGRPQKKK
jgi:hypothetical protein